MRLIQFLAMRAKGEIKTGARFIRDFVYNHPKYMQDSQLNDEICWDLIKVLSKINDEDCEARLDLLGEFA